ncbi:MAG TPA: undecaprenyl-phosphate glucose phosphotransferase [Candidatus Eisenbacteria bacterium]|jgi:Undecaprenyl-phosphate glucose phosphotransferase
MLARQRQLLATGVFFFDGALIFGAWLAAYELRFHWLDWPAPLGVPPLTLYLWFGAVITLGALLILRTLHLYRSARTARLGRELYAVTLGMIATAALAALASFFARGELARSVLLIFSVLAWLALCASRVGIRILLREMRRRGRNLRHVLVVGTGDLAATLLRKIAAHRDFGLAVEGVVAAEPGDLGRSVEGAPVVGTVYDLHALVEQKGAELVYLALARSEYRAEEEALKQLNDSTAAVRLVPDLARAFRLNASVEDFDGMPVVLVTESPDLGWNGVMKRSFDLVLSGVGLALLSPLLAAIALWVRLDSPGPVLYSQERVGLSGRRFRMLKFRTMRADAETDDSPGWTRPNDPRRTGAGAVLRRLSLDELPQLWNVFLGQMSLVGPRPERPVYVEQFRASIPRYMLRHHVKAGITGWAQVNGLRGDTPLERRIEYDLYYIRNWSMLFDVRILLLTLVRVFRDASAH